MQVLDVQERQELIAEIEALLNRIDHKHPSYLSPDIVAELDTETLLSIKAGLVAKKGNEIAQNQKWLFGLLNS